MIKLVVTNNTQLYHRLAVRIRSEGDTPHHATNALDGFQCAVRLRPNAIIVDMSLHAADTLVETLHSRDLTAGIPLYAVQSDHRLPLELRRLCTGVLEAGKL